MGQQRSQRFVGVAQQGMIFRLCPRASCSLERDGGVRHQLAFVSVVTDFSADVLRSEVACMTVCITVELTVERERVVPIRMLTMAETNHSVKLTKVPIVQECLLRVCDIVVKE